MKSPARFRAAPILAALAFAMLLGAGFMALSCGGGGERGGADDARGTRAASRDAGPLRVVCTTTIVADLARSVGGPDVVVTALIPPGADPHAWRPGRADREAIASADLVMMVGRGLEARAAGTLVKAARGRPLVAVADSLHPALLITDPEDEEKLDPHVWLEPALWIKAAYVVGRALAFEDPAHEPGYSARANDFVGAMGPVVQWAEGALDSIPAERRIFATTGDGRAYFARAFRWQIISPATARTEIRGRVKGDRLVELLVTRRAPVLFVESTEPRSHADRLADEARGRGHDLRVVAGLHGESFDAPGSSAATWEGALRADVAAMIAALR